MADNGKDSAGVEFPPPLIYLGFLLAGFGLDYYLPMPLLPGLVQYPIGIALITAGFLPAMLAMRGFRRAGTATRPNKPATAIVSDGPFRYTRNPMYLGLTTTYVGIAIAGDSLLVLLLLIPVLVIMRRAVIDREEKYLEAKFGEEYLRYKASVRRWL